MLKSSCMAEGQKLVILRPQDRENNQLSSRSGVTGCAKTAFCLYDKRMTKMRNRKIDQSFERSCVKQMSDKQGKVDIMVLLALPAIICSLISKTLMLFSFFSVYVGSYLKVSRFNHIPLLPLPCRNKKKTGRSNGAFPVLINVACIVP